ncbi:MAG: hypothetical protein K5682_05340 [Lachnospiraceae bacterium]|nr:hypothetical protein [Lachnospiraceae bacterium]
MVIAWIAMTILFVVCKFLQKKLSSGQTTGIFVTLSILWGILILLAGIFCRNNPQSFYDYGICYDAAYEFATTGSLSNASYFAFHPHNWKCVYVLSVIFQIGMKVGFSDPYYFLILVRLVLMEGTLYSCRYLLRKEDEEKPSDTGLFLICTVMLCLPIYAYGQAFYTDSISACVPMIGFALIRYAYGDVRKKWVKYLLYFAGGMVIGFGCIMKITAAIPVIAIAFYLVIFRSRKNAIKEAGVPVILVTFGILVMYLGSELVCSSHSWYQEGKNAGEPAISFVALGLKGDGSYIENQEFKNALAAQGSRDAMEEFSIAYIHENAGNFLDLDHVRRKMQTNYASGNLGASDFANYPYEGENNLLNELFYSYGTLYWYGCKYCLIYQFQLYLVMLLGGIVYLYDIYRKKKPDPWMVIAPLSFIGCFVFLFFWEANNRQLYNQMPVLILGYVVSMGYIGNRRRISK